jgi:hypothetical protein
MKTIANAIHHFLVPHERNNFRAKAVHFHSLVSYLIFFIAIGFLINATGAKGNVLGYATDITIEKLLELTNKERADKGLQPLTYNQQLAVAAKGKADDMFARNYWAHYAPDGTTPWSFILGSGYKYEYAGENLAKNFMFSDGVVQAWMDSPTHRENILRAEYTDIGFAIVDGVLNGEETTLVVQMFGTPYGGVPAVQAAEPQENPGGVADPNADLSEEQAPVEIKQPRVAVQPGEASQILSDQSRQPSLFRLFYNTNLLFVVFLILAFALDLYVAVRLNIVHLRFGGKNLVHMLFLGFILVGLIIAAGGKIL